MAKSSPTVNRRDFLTLTAALPFAALLGRSAAVTAATPSRTGLFNAEVGILHGVLSFRLAGVIDETIDRVGGRYHVRANGEGRGIANRIESQGAMRDGRWTPDRASSWFLVAGRESHSDIVYDWPARKIKYRFRGETFFLGRLRVVEDTVVMHGGVHVDDVVTAVLNYADEYWKPHPTGMYRTNLIRRRRRDDEDPDDVDPNAGAELVPFELKVSRENPGGKSTASLDMTRFSSWARSGHPARVVFGANRRPELITTSLVLGTSITIRLPEP